jgi:hypothetical protein
VTQPERPGPRRPPDRFTRLSARFQGALPLLIVYFALAAIYAWQASQRPVPTIFVDELQITQLSRAIAETGHAARRGVPYGMPSLVAYALAPAWWLGTTSAAYATAKLILVLAMTATLFPAYALARLVLPPWYALAAAGGSIAVPALAYSPILVQEPLAYPLSTLSLWLIARVLVHRSPGRIALAALASAAAALTRTQLVVLFVVLVLGLLWLAWQSEEVRRWRATWGLWDKVGAVVVAIGIWIVLSSAIGHASTSWRNTNAIYKDRIFHHAMWSTGALAIGIGILPLLLGLAALARPSAERRDPSTRAFVATCTSALMAFIWYAGIKGAYISTVFGTIVAERNVIYLCPVLFAATALAIHRGVGRWWAVAAATGFTLYVVPGTPLHLGQFPYYEAHGLEMPAFANRVLGWPEGTIKAALWTVCVASFAVVVALRLLERDVLRFRVVAGSAAAIVVAWSMTTEVYAAKGERHLSRMIDENIVHPYDWVDRTTGEQSVAVLGQAITDPTGIWETEFFNRSIRKMWSLDGSAIRVGSPILTPDLKATNGTLTPSPGTQYALALNGVELQAPLVKQMRNDRLYRLDGKPMRLAAAIIGQESDGWVVGSVDESNIARASYTRYLVSPNDPDFVVVLLSRLGWCPMPPRSTVATVRIGTVAIGPDKQPTIGRVLRTERKRVHDCTTRGFAFARPDVPWRVEVTISPTVRPHDVDPSKSERRYLGATMEVKLESLFNR